VNYLAPEAFRDCGQCAMKSAWRRNRLFAMVIGLFGGVSGNICGGCTVVIESRMKLTVKQRQAISSPIIRNAGSHNSIFQTPTTCPSARKIMEPSLRSKTRRWHKLTTAALDGDFRRANAARFAPAGFVRGHRIPAASLRVMQGIAWGRTLSYVEVAAKIGQPEGDSRSGQRVRRPTRFRCSFRCHRVLAAHQRLGGFSAGLDWKRKLLAMKVCLKVTARRTGSWSLNQQWKTNHAKV